MIAQPIITSKRNQNLKENVHFLQVYPSFPVLASWAGWHFPFSVSPQTLECTASGSSVPPALTPMP